MTTYLDYNATAPLLVSVKTRMMELMHTPLNPSAVHKYGQHARGVIQAARHALANYIQADAEDIIFTSGGTEANNLALQGVPWDTVFISAVEHASLYRAHPNAHTLPVDQNGILNLNILESTLKNANGKLNLISVLWAHNETGVIQPLKDIIEIAHRYGVLVHTDAVQAIGKLPIRFKDLALDLMTISAHKFGGPQGIGALIVRPHVPLNSMLRGGGQEKGRRSGTENILGIAGFAEAVQNAPSLSHLSKWHQEMEASIAAEIQNLKDFKIIGNQVERLPNVSCLLMPDVPNETQVMSFDLAGIAVSAGSACSSGTVKSTRILQNLGLSPNLAGTAIRVSSGWNTRQEDLESFKNVWLQLYRARHQKLRKVAS